MEKNGTASVRGEPVPEPIRNLADWPLSPIGYHTESLRATIEAVSSKGKRPFELPESAKPLLEEALARLSAAQSVWEGGNDHLAIDLLCLANRCYGASFEDPRAIRAELARSGALAMLARNPVQAAKAEARKLWNERHAGKHPRLRTNEQFATECMRRWPVLTSSAVITGWCTNWNKAAKARKS